jgi:hypothetical protein
VTMPLSQVAAYAAHEMLTSLLTDPAQGLVGPPPPLDTPLHPPSSQP